MTFHISEGLNRQWLAWQQPPAAASVGGRPAAERSRRTDTAPAMSRRNLINFFTNSKVHRGRAVRPWVKTVTFQNEFQCSLNQQVVIFITTHPSPIYVGISHTTFNRRCWKCYINTLEISHSNTQLPHIPRSEMGKFNQPKTGGQTRKAKAQKEDKGFQLKKVKQFRSSKEITLGRQH